jgi:hypothetical protein
MRAMSLLSILKKLAVRGGAVESSAQRPPGNGQTARHVESIFTQIHDNNGWNGKESVSGTGSDLTQTRRIVELLPRLFAKYGVRTMLDIPCGDFFWLSKVDLRGVNYTGADIVEELVLKNKQHETADRTFAKLNLLSDRLPTVDLVFVRDCLVHFSFADIFEALRTMTSSGSTYLLTTTFLRRDVNADIATGDWRPLNLRRAPFNLPCPLEILEEGCTEFKGMFADKALGLWHLADIDAACFPRSTAHRPKSRVA